MNRTKRPRAFLLATVLILGLLLLPVIGKAVAELAGIAKAAEQQDYIYFDLALGDVKIGKNSYSGKVNVAGTTTTVSSNTRTGAEKFYIYQSTAGNQATTGYVTNEDYTNKNCTVPTYNRVEHGGQLWTEYITNNTKVEEVIDAWAAAAEASNRELTEHYITFDPGTGYTANVTIDNIWSSYCDVKIEGRTSGGIGAHLGNNTDTKIHLWLKGDNRVSSVHYFAEQGHRNEIHFHNGEDGNQLGSITVADFPDKLYGNHWCAAIGGNDNGNDRSDGIVIDGGVIYAGTTAADNCTAIGGGGNEYGGVTINDGIVTAVAATTGTAIGGGIGWGDKGGNADVTINKGEVYAYNFGVDNSSSDKFEHYVPAVAIGGGSSQRSRGNDRTTVTIKGGTVYAQCMGGAAIGGGGSATQTGGNATINISGGTIIAKSTTGRFKGTADPDVVDIPAGVSIGGGTGKTGGGSVILNISGGTLRTGSIGGGKCTGSGHLGSATVTIDDGDITGQVIMAGTGDPNKKCSFTMKDGRIHATNVVEGNTITDILDPQQDVPILYLEKNGGAVWMQDTLGVTNISGGTIEGCTANLGGAIYMEGGTFTLSGAGKISGNTAKRTEATATTAAVGGMGGAVYVTGGNANINGGSVSGNKAQIRGGGVYVTGGNVKVTGGSVSGNKAGFAPENGALPTNVGRGGGVYLEGKGLFTMTGGEISDNEANYRGGGIFLTRKPVLTKGTISGNKANDSGGGICVNGDAVELNSENMKIFGNTAKNGGGVAVLNGSFILSGGAVGVENAAEDKVKKPNTATNGGGVYVAEDAATSAGGSSTASVTVTSGNIWYNKATNGGGVYLESGDFSMQGEATESAFIRHNIAAENGGGVYLKAGKFTMDDETAFVSGNSAKNGGGIYLYTNPELRQGTIKENTATENGGGMFISDCKVGLNPTADVTVTGNHAKNGAGIYIHDSTGGSTPADGSVDAVTSSTIPKVGLRVGKKGTPFTGRLIFTNNIATQSGGAVCIDAGQFNLESGNITMTGNKAVNGGGVAVLKGNFTMLTGAIGENNGANHATNGGGVFVSDGEIWLKGGRIQYNQATDGGGAYVTVGRMFMTDGSLNNNTATENGGGAYAAGNFRMLGGTVGGAGGENRAKNGGGVYVNEGDVNVIYGEISHNYASRDGGGFHVSAADKEVQVLMLSGSLSYNRADQNGGGMAVESNNNQTITVEIGCLLDHYNDQNVITYPVEYTDNYAGYATFDKKPYHHDSCPEVKGNNAGSIGGGFYLNSDASTVSFFCVEETGNKAQGEDSAGMDVVGGRVIVGDEEYHNHYHDTGEGGNHWGRPRGNVSMENAALVNGGQVDIYGDMTNPIFKDEVTVSIQSQEDHFKDHRRSKNEKSYKVHYFENFNDTGLYQATQYNEGHTEITIEAAYYSHPGYQILGWCTTPVRDETNPNSRYYAVGDIIDLATLGEGGGMGVSDAECDRCGGAKDDNLLVLYAIWKAYGYTVVFDPNVQPGDTYTGTMDKQIFNYDETKKLLKNKYQYPGYLFTGWSMNADGTGTLHADEAEVTNLTDQNGVEITLYAQWVLCDHKDPHRWTYEVSEDGKTLLRICSCGRQTLHATLYAENTVYNGLSHPATMTLDDPDAWGTDKPTIVYTGERLKPEDETNYGALEFDANGIPYHASKYTASITKNNGETPVTASVQYTIAKADQNAPETPTYEIADTKQEVKIKKLASNQITDEANKPHTAEVEYRLSHYAESNLKYTAWQKITNGADHCTITMTTALTNYNVEVRYEELEDYNPSEITRADDVFFYEGNITVIVKCDKGIDYDMVFAKGTNTTSNGITLTLNLKTGYYLVGGDYTVTKTLKEESDSVPSDPVTVPKSDKGNNIYSIVDIPDNSTLTITIGTTRKRPDATAKVTPGQKFSTFAGVATTISRDSAFTAAFEIDNFDPRYTRDGSNYGVYSNLKLTFGTDGSKIPEGTTIILLDRGQNGAKTYWYYRAAAEVDSVLLTEFKKMGGTGNYAIPAPAETDGYVDLNYQFVVDFSQSAGGCSGESLTMQLTAVGKDVTVPEINPQVTVSMANSGFTFTQTDATVGLTHSFGCGFSITKNGTAVTESGIASKWENRASALILTPAAGTALPSDASIVAVIGNSTTVLYKSGDSFIIPMSLLQTGTRQVQLTLKSALFPAEGASYSFTAQWWISPSKAGKAPKAEAQKGETLNVIFTSSVRKTPSLKILDGSRVLTKAETLKLSIDTKNMETGYAIEAALLRKAADGTYIETGWNDETVTKEQGLRVPLNACEPGSYCLKVTVKEENSITIVLEVPYYFVVRQTQ